MKRVGVVADPAYREHRIGFSHPESPERLRAVYELLDEGWARTLHHIPPREATAQEICLVHDPDYEKVVEKTALSSGVSLDPDTYACPDSYRIAKLAVGGLLESVRFVLEKKVDNAFALLRPPGHHAETARAMGFCFFNNVAIGAKWAQKEFGLKRVLIVDWDLHHGNGTEHAFYSDPSVLYFSTHQYPYYPGTGAADEVGVQQGEGRTVNVPLPAGEGDAEHIAAFERILIPVAEAFDPEFVLVSAGFDSHHRDPLGGMRVTEAGFAELARIVTEIANRHADGRLVLALEGGYDLQGLKDSVRSVFQILQQGESREKEDRIAISSPVEDTLERVRSIQSAYWSILK